MCVSVCSLCVCVCARVCVCVCVVCVCVCIHSLCVCVRTQKCVCEVTDMTSRLSLLQTGVFSRKQHQPDFCGRPGQVPDS